MNILKTIFTVFLLSSINFAFAIDAPENIKLDKATDNSLEISWDDVDGASVYGISYGLKSASGGVYENELGIITDQESKGIIADLDSDTTYYLAIKAYNENNEESEYSEEVSFSTLKKLEDLQIKNVEIIDSKNIKLIFNVDLDVNSEVNLNIVNKNNDLENIEVENYKIENNELYILLNTDLKEENTYSITIITIAGKNGETIKAGVDGVYDFYVNLDSLNSGEDNQDVNVDLNSGEDNQNINVSNNEDETNKILGGEELNNSSNVTETVAKDKKDLPTTGPAETFLFLLFSFLAGGLFLILRKKINI